MTSEKNLTYDVINIYEYMEVLGDWNVYGTDDMMIVSYLYIKKKYTKNILWNGKSEYILKPCSEGSFNIKTLTWSSWNDVWGQFMWDKSPTWRLKQVKSKVMNSWWERTFIIKNKL